MHSLTLKSFLCTIIMDSRTLHKCSLHQSQVMSAERQKLGSGQCQHAMEYLDYHPPTRGLSDFSTESRVRTYKMKVQQLDMQLKPQVTDTPVGFIPAVACRAVRAEGRNACLHRAREAGEKTSCAKLMEGSVSERDTWLFQVSCTQDTSVQGLKGY